MWRERQAKQGSLRDIAKHKPKGQHGLLVGPQPSIRKQKLKFQGRQASAS